MIVLTFDDHLNKNDKFNKKLSFFIIFWSMLQSSGLYYKHVTIVNDNSSIVSKWSFKLIDDPRVIIYDHHRFIIQATDVIVKKISSSLALSTNKLERIRSKNNIWLSLAWLLAIETRAYQWQSTYESQNSFTTKSADYFAFSAYYLFS